MRYAGFDKQNDWYALRMLPVGLVLLACLFVVKLTAPTPLFAQSATGGVNGVIADVTGGVIPDVTMTLTNQGTGLAATALTNVSGFYAFTSVAPGPYTLKAGKSGFKTATVPGFRVDVNQTVTQNITLSVGDVSQSVEVTAQAPLLQASSSELGTVIAGQAVERLPLNGRNFTQLLLLTPGVSPVDTSQEWGSTPSLPGSTWIKPSVNGQWDRSDVFLMDGIINLEGETSGYALLPSLDSIAEFKVQSHNDMGEFGMVMGGNINLVTKSGTNQLHGGGFEFVRNQIFDARNPFTDIAPVNPDNPAVLRGPAVFRQNQFGATLGGPVYIPHLYDGRNKTFFFFSYDGWRYTRAEAALYRVPTTAELGGDFSDWPEQIYDPATTRPDPANPGEYIRDPFPGNIIQPNRIDSMMLQSMKFFYEQPNISVGFNNVLNNKPLVNNENGYMVRIDHQISPKSNLFFRYNYTNIGDRVPLTLIQTQFDAHGDQQVVMGWNQILSPSVAFNTRFAWSTVPWNSGLLNPYSDQQYENLGWSQIERFKGGNLNWSIPGEIGLSAANSPIWQHHHQLSQDLSWMKGNHQVKFGWVMFRQYWSSVFPYFGANFATDQTADPEATGGLTGVGLASALLGLPEQIYGATEYYNQRYYTWGFYGEDKWKVSRNLTLNGSLRWEFADPPQYYVKTANDFDINSGNYWLGGTSVPGPCSTVGAAPCIPADVVGDPHIVLAPRPNIKPAHRKNFEPRLGAAWQLTPKNVLRVGAGVAYDVLSGQTQENNNIDATWPNASYAYDDINALGQPLTSAESGEQARLAPLPDPTPWLDMNYDYDTGKKPPYSVQYNVQIQREFTSNLTASIAYVGSVDRRLDDGWPVNSATTPGPGTADQVNQRRPFPYIPISFWYSNDAGTSSYNSMQLELNRRFSGGKMLLAGYTYSKTMTNGDSGWFGSENGPSGATSIQNAYDLNSNRGVAAYDVPHNLWVSGTWELPAGKGKKWLQSGPLSRVLGNWRTDFIQSMRSGQPWNPIISGDVANVGRTVDWTGYLRPNLIGNPNISNRSPSMWVNTAAFGIPQFAYGNVGWDSFRSKSAFSTDLAVVREFHMGEKAMLQFRGEGFNIFNVMNYGVPNAVLNNSSFGTITGLAGNQYPRQLQFSLRISF